MSQAVPVAHLLELGVGVDHRAHSENAADRFNTGVVQGVPTKRGYAHIPTANSFA